MAESVLAGAAAAFVAARPVGHLATVRADGRPRVMPVCFAWDGAEIWIALDTKPKRDTDPLRLGRVRDILAFPHVALVVDDYLAAWDQLAYVLVTGPARVATPADLQHAAAIVLLREKYAQYRAMPIEERPAIAIRPEHVTAWGAVEARALRPVFFETTIVGRRSVRRFAPSPIGRERIERVLEAARWAPSPHGRQPWRFVVVTERATKDRLADAMGEEWRVTLGQDGEPEAVVAQRLDASRQRIRTAPVLIVACLYLAEMDRYPDAARQQAEQTMATQSLGAAIQNMLLAAYHEGLDMGWMCAPLFCQPAVQSALDLPADWLPHALLPLGVAAADPRRRPRRPLDDLVRWD
jgi:coenzyme F420-0:L-glutamate ligase/coenzyme F420-1:gamma-L-glutamate ligase